MILSRLLVRPVLQHSIFQPATVFVSSVRPTGASLILFAMILDRTTATSVHIIPIALNIKNDEITFPGAVKKN